MSASSTDVNTPIASGQLRCHEELSAFDHIRFFSALYAPDDILLFRPLETWSENGKKQARTIYKHTIYRAADPMIMHVNQGLMLRIAEREKANIFFGVCPRLGDNGRFDLAWQIRKVSALWADIDHCSVEEALARCNATGIPTPSVVVNSGNGVHLYWCLDTPYLITDAGDPPAIQGEWIEKDGKRKLRRYYIDEHGDEIPIEKRHLHPPLSSQAQFIQDVLAGLAAKIGGDHTQDLSRLLRVPGTLNRKNERNGQAPVPCTLVKCDANCRYSMEQFAEFAAASPAVTKRAAIAAMPLPRPRKLTPSKLDKLDDWIARCRIAEKGTRSSIDFGLCCFAIRSAIAREEVWSRVQDIGKFAEGGERYFDRTWSRAEERVRTDKYSDIDREDNGHRHEPLQDDDLTPTKQLPPDDEDVIVVDSSVTPVAQTMQRITDVMLKTGTAYHRAGTCVVLRNQQLDPLTSPQELAGHLNQFVEFYFVESKGGGYKPLSTALGNTWLHHPTERARLQEIKLFTRSPVYTSDFRLVAPGYDADSGIYFAGEAVTPRTGTTRLDELLREFCFRTNADRTNYLAMLLTIPLVYHFIGSKPGTLFNGNQPGLGKTILAQLLAILRDGSEIETATYNPNDEELEKRLGAIVRNGGTTIVIDNAKTQARAPRIESPCLERLITDQVLSFRLLGTSTAIRAENSHFFCITANSSDVSRDLITRCLVVNLHHEGDPTERSFAISDPQAYAHEHRQELLGELLGMVEHWKAAGQPEAEVSTRFNKRGWGRIIGGILAVNGYQGFLSNTAEAAKEFDETQREFQELVQRMADTPGRWFRTSELTTLAVQHKLLGNDLGDGGERSQQTRMGKLVTRYVARRFELDDQRLALFVRECDRKGPLYGVKLEDNIVANTTALVTTEEVPDVEARLPDVEAQTSGICKCHESNGLPDLPDVARPFSLTSHACEEKEVCVMCVSHIEAVGKGPAGQARLACDHLNPSSWTVRDGSAYCPVCDRFMGRIRP